MHINKNSYCLSNIIGEWYMEFMVVDCIFIHKLYKIHKYSIVTKA